MNTAAFPRPSSRRAEPIYGIPCAHPESLFIMNLKLPSLLVATLTCFVLLGESAKPAIANQTNWFKISGMHCNGCAGGIRSELRQTAGVADATVSFTNKLAMVAYDTNSVTPKQLIGVIKEAGYSAKVTQAP